MGRQVRGNRREIEREVARFPGVRVTFEEGGRHIRAKVTFREGSRIVTISSTASDCRALRNQIADVRRAIRELMK
jgi:hypothetical protein